MALRLLAGGLVPDISASHGCSTSSVRRSFWSVVNAILADPTIGPLDFDPHNEEYLQEKCDLFRSKRSGTNLIAPFCVGAVDGLAIHIADPAAFVDSPNDYYNRKKFFSINCQGVCDANRRFLHFTCNSPGATHDSAAFATSQHYPSLVRSLPGERFIVGDNAYPNTGGLLTPFSATSGRERGSGAAVEKEGEEMEMEEKEGEGEDQGALNGSKDAFNDQLSSCRRVIGSAFGMLVRRWGVFWKRLEFSPAQASRVIMCCVKLHNFILDEEKKRATKILRIAHAGARGVTGGEDVYFQDRVSCGPALLEEPSVGSNFLFSTGQQEGTARRDGFVQALDDQHPHPPLVKPLQNDE